MKIEVTRTYELDIEDVQLHLTETDVRQLRDKLNEILGEMSFRTYVPGIRGGPMVD